MYWNSTAMFKGLLSNNLKEMCFIPLVILLYNSITVVQHLQLALTATLLHIFKHWDCKMPLEIITQPKMRTAPLRYVKILTGILQDLFKPYRYCKMWVVQTPYSLISEMWLGTSATKTCYYLKWYKSSKTSAESPYNSLTCMYQCGTNC